MAKCEICGCTDFYKNSGYLYCESCQTQQNVEDVDMELSMGARLQKKKLPKQNLKQAENGWTSWELYNFVMIGLSNELIELGAPSSIKLTILQLWTRYLGKLEVAFVSTKKKVLPKFSRKYKKKDAEIIYGKMLSQNKSRKSRKTANDAMSFVASNCQDNEEINEKKLNKTKNLMMTAEYDKCAESQTNLEKYDMTYSESMHSFQSNSTRFSQRSRIQFNAFAKEEIKKVKNKAKSLPKHERTKYKESFISNEYQSGPKLITPLKLWAILYLALRIHDQDIHLGDMIRFAREGHLSYYRLDYLIPSEITLARSEAFLLSRVSNITHTGLRKIIGKMAEFLGVNIICPDLLSFITRYCTELHLPRGISLYAERLMALFPPKMKYESNKKFLIPNYEGRAMAFIIVVMKMLLGLDGITEYEISKVAAKINSIMQQQCNKTFKSPCIFVHGENFDNDEIIIEKMISCKNAASTGYESLLNGASAVKAVETALWWLECDEFFNCGYGSVLNEIGDVQMDASIIDGSKLEYGSVAAVSNIEHPISLAKYVLECFPNSIVVGKGAKKLAKYAEFDCLSKRDMIAPAAYSAYKLKEKLEEMEEDSIYCCADSKIEDNANAIIENDANSTIKNNANLNIESYQTEVFENIGNVGCIAYDGQNIAVGVTSGGLNKKLEGNVSGSSIMGCNAYANRNVGCSLTGHEESIMKLCLARVIANDIENECSPWKALKENLDYMLKNYNYTGGGIAFKKSGEWGLYFTATRMPYVIIMNEHVTFGTTLVEKNVEKYIDRNLLPCNAIDNENISDLKLFNFWEWQNYIECRKAVLVNAHYPTKLKYNSNIPDVKSLYIKFLDFIKSKTDRSTPEMMTCNYKRLIPEEYAQIMAHCINNINDTNSHELNNELNEFSPSLTPHHSYLQELLNHPLWDLPSILRNDFTSTKIRYMTKPDFICTLSMQYDMSLNIIDSNLHFLEKTVPFFEIIKMAEIKELTDDIEVQESSLEEQIKMTEEKESFIEYMHKKMSCQIKIDTKKKQYYNTICNRITNTKTSPPTSSNSEFIFNEVLPNGKLSIPSNKIDDDDDDENDDTCIKDTVRKAELSKFCKAYDIHLSSTEKEVLLTNKRLARKKKRILLRKNGKFVKYNNGDSRCKSDSPSEDEDSDKEIEAVLENDLKIDNISPKNNTVSDLSKNNTIYEHGDQSRRRRKTFKKTDNSAFEPDANDNIVKHNNLYRPFTDYWVYHCNFGQINSKSFKLFEKMLPRSFRWLLKECANVLEMPMEDLYEEVCTVEAYCIHMSEQCNTDGKRDKYPNICTILKKW